MRRSGLVSLGGILVLTAILFSLTLVFGYSPLLGLDLQGGVEVVLRPAEGQEVTTEKLDLSTEIIRRRVDSLGVAEPDVTRQGDNVVVQLPGVDNQEQAVELVGQTGKLEFRPLLAISPLSCTERVLDSAGWVIPGQDVFDISEEYNSEEITEINNQITAAIDDYDTALAAGEEVPQIPECRDREETEEDDESTEDAGSTDETTTDTTTDTTIDETTTDTTTDTTIDETTTDTTQPEAPTEEESETPSEEDVPDTQSDDEQNNEDAADPTTTEDPSAEDEPSEDDSAEDVAPEDSLAGDAEAEDAEAEEAETDELEPHSDYILNRALILTNPTTANAEDHVLYLREDPSEPGTFQKALLGPTLVDGSSLENASAVLSGIATWSVQLVLLPGEEGIDLFNMAAQTCAGRLEECPTAILGITLDGFVESAPQVTQTQYDRENVSITGNFSESEARNLALTLRYGALPLEFDDPVEAGLVRSVSATLGKDSLNAGIIAAIIGIGMVALYMIFYYRLVGAAAIASLSISGILLWVIVSYLSETQGLALTLAGITGLIVSIGVSLDSNVIYFENLKEDLANGRTLRSSVDKAFPKAFKTIFWANLATLIGAGILWWLTIGSVKGFAAMLAIASILDLVATYFFLRPSVKMLAHSKWVKKNSTWLIGIKDNAPV